MIKDFYNISPRELEPGDVLLCTVKLMVMNHRAPDGSLLYRLYRCRYDGDEEPQGMKLESAFTQDAAETIFPVVSTVAQAD